MFRYTDIRRAISSCMSQPFLAFGVRVSFENWSTTVWVCGSQTDCGQHHGAILPVASSAGKVAFVRSAAHFLCIAIFRSSLCRLSTGLPPLVLVRRQCESCGLRSLACCILPLLRAL